MERRSCVQASRLPLLFSRDDVIGEKIWETRWFQRSDHTQKQVRRAVKRAANDGFVRRDLTVSGADGEAVIDFSIRPLTDDQGNVRLLIPEGRVVTGQGQDEQISG